MISHFIHVLLGIGAVIGVIGIILGWFTHVIYHRVRFGKNAHQK